MHVYFLNISSIEGLAEVFRMLYMHRSTLYVLRRKYAELLSKIPLKRRKHDIQYTIEQSIKTDCVCKHFVHCFNLVFQSHYRFNQRNDDLKVVAIDTSMFKIRVSIHQPFFRTFLVLFSKFRTMRFSQSEVVLHSN